MYCGREYTSSKSALPRRRTLLDVCAGDISACIDSFLCWAVRGTGLNAQGGLPYGLRAPKVATPSSNPYSGFLLTLSKDLVAQTSQSKPIGPSLLLPPSALPHTCYYKCLQEPSSAASCCGTEPQAGHQSHSMRSLVPVMRELY